MSRELRRLTSVTLSHGWHFKGKDVKNYEEWLPVSKIPSVVHLDLMDNQKIPDPYISFNELDVEWVGEQTWTYRTTFKRPSNSETAQAVLVFEGLDTLATVKLDGETILESDNMFLSHRVNVSDLVLPSKEAVIEIDFASALLHGREMERTHPEHRFIACNGEAGRIAIRKAQYHWGWDWGPVLMTAGPWRPARFDVHEDLGSAKGSVHIQTEGDADTVAFTVKLHDQIVVQEEVPVQRGKAMLTVELQGPQLWYRHGYGSQPLYEVSADISKDEIVLDCGMKKIGLRRSELMKKEDSHGQSFYFKINGIDVFCGGNCWIPAVWGGGIYEESIFYDLCDEFGILVWQDFMFACASYPAWPSFLKSVEEEAIQNLRRLRHHPSIVIYAGNNEDYQVAESFSLEYNSSDKDPSSWLKTNYPARYIFEKLLPDIMASESPDVPYWPSSPFSGGKLTSDPTTGDIHQWNVWHGTQEKYQTFENLGGRFVSEFGIEAFPHLQTIRHFVEDPCDMHPQSHTLDFHNKAEGHERRIATYLAYIHLTQLVQSEALMYAYRGWRRQWGQDRKCGGALVWQMNDVWPGASWSIVDYFLRKKPAYYSMARALKPIAIGVQRKHHDWSISHARPAKDLPYDVWIVSSNTNRGPADVEIRFISVNTGKDVRKSVTRKGVVVQEVGTTEVLSGVIDNAVREPYVLSARLFIDDVCVSHDIDWPQPFKYLSMKDRGITVVFLGDQISVTAERPTKDLVLEERDGVSLSDNAIDVVPGEEVVIEARGLQTSSKPLSFRYLGQDE